MLWQVEQDGALHDRTALSFREFVWLIVTFRDGKAPPARDPQQRARDKDEWREFFDFKDFELTKYTAEFRKRDRDGSGTISAEALAALLDTTVLANSPVDDRQALRQALLGRPPPAEGVGLQGVLRIARAVQDHVEWCNVAKESAAAKACSFSPADVEASREIFKSFDSSGVGLILHEDLLEALWGVVQGARRPEAMGRRTTRRTVASAPEGTGVPSARDARLSPGAVAAHRERRPPVLEEMPLEESERLQGWLQEADTDGSGCIDFAEFLRLMYIVQRENWCNINRAAERVLEANVQAVRRLNTAPLKAGAPMLEEAEADAAPSAPDEALQNDAFRLRGHGLAAQVGKTPSQTRRNAVVKRAENMFRMQRVSVKKRASVAASFASPDPGAAAAAPGVAAALGVRRSPRRSPAAFGGPWLRFGGDESSKGSRGPCADRTLLATTLPDLAG
ncbi:unnamed protein product [Prorocentrum cordatum]|uniref:EF-hand domain-containing protein n=1 Tax=Prorocentrum cordatum TaxID=2364126 RepID=A0ABN9W477_9DINO|nr:unnamed protein product [Polarella glacialis]